MTDIPRFAERLTGEGYVLVFGVTGSGPSYRLVSELTARGVRYIPVSNEGCGAVAAGAYTFLHGRRAAALAIKGPGFANLLAGVAACHLERFEVLAIVEDYDESAPLEREHKRLDQIAMAWPVARTMGSLSDSGTWDEFFAPSVGRYGPRVFELANVRVERAAPVSAPSPLSDAELKSAISKIGCAQRPLLIVGSLIGRLGYARHLTEMQLPVLTTAQAKGLIDERLGHAAGVYTGVGLDLSPEVALIAASDCVVTIGLRNCELLGVQDKTRCLNFDVAPDGFDPHMQFLSLRQLAEILEALLSARGWAAGLVEAQRAALAQYVAESSWMPAQVFDAINALPGACTLILDTGFFCTVGEHIYVAGRRRRFLGSSNGRNMGLSVPMAMGAAIDGEATICCVGDGGIRYHLGDVRTIAELGLPVCFMLFSDGRYGSIEAYVGELRGTADGPTRPLGTSWRSTFETMGIRACAVSDRATLDLQLAQWDARTPLFLELRFDAEEYRHMTSRLRR